MNLITKGRTRTDKATPRLARAKLIALATIALAMLAGCAPTASGEAHAQTSAKPGGIVTFALPPGLYPNSIYPLASPSAVPSGSYISIQDFQMLMWRPLYWFGNNGQPGINYKLSLANPPVFSDSGRTVTITLKHVLWSNGSPVTNRDVEFYMDLFLANRTDYYNYVPGYIPDNLVSEHYSSTNPLQFSLTFNRSYNPTWLLYNQLSEIEPFPQAAWDRLSLSGPSGNFASTTSGAVAVQAFLTKEDLNVGAYATSFLWHDVDGPWELSAYVPASGYSVFTPNPKYFLGKPRIAKFVEEPFTSDTSEFDAVLSGNLDYGYVPPVDAKVERAQLAARGYKLYPWTQWGIDWFPINFANPAVGPIFKQLYFRQALQYLVNQKQYIADIMDGFGYPTYGPVPLRPKNSYITKVEQANPYPFSVQAAIKLLSANGWSVHPKGLTVCTRPGSGPSECGAGIKLGQGLSFTMVYASGSLTLSDEMAVLQSTAAEVGIKISLSSEPGGTVIGTVFGCDASTGKGCSWQMGDASVNGFAWTYSPDYYPSGESLFVPGAVADEGSYNNSHATELIKATNTDTGRAGQAAMAAYEDYIARDLPVIWMPTGYYQISAIKTTLRGALPQDPNVQIYPENWEVS